MRLTATLMDSGMAACSMRPKINGDLELVKFVHRKIGLVEKLSDFKKIHYAQDAK